MKDGYWLFRLGFKGVRKEKRESDRPKRLVNGPIGYKSGFTTSNVHADLRPACQHECLMCVSLLTLQLAWLRSRCRWDREDGHRWKVRGRRGKSWSGLFEMSWYDSPLQRMNESISVSPRLPVFPALLQPPPFTIPLSLPLSLSFPLPPSFRLSLLS